MALANDEGLREKQLSVKTVVQGGVVRFDFVDVELPDGGRARRDIVRHPGGCAVVAVDEAGDVFLVRQYRVPIDKVTLELPAGKLEPGEPPIECAARELREETGATASYIRQVAALYASPGFCDEVIRIFLATGLASGQAEPDSGEYVDAIKMPLAELVGMAMRGELEDAKTAYGILYAARALGV